MSEITFAPPVAQKYEIHQWRNAFAVLASAHLNEWNDILAVLGSFRLLRSDIITPGGRKSPIAKKLDESLFRLGWVEKAFETSISVDAEVFESPTHKVDCFKNRVALEVEWNNKDPSTTHMSRLLPRIEGGGGGGCPVAVFGIRKDAYVED